MAMISNTLLVTAASALIASAPATAAPGGMLVETQLADPDPGYVPPPAERKAASTPRKAKDPTLDEAFEGFGRAIGQAAQVMHQKAVDRAAKMPEASEPPNN